MDDDLILIACDLSYYRPGFAVLSCAPDKTVRV